MTKFDTYDDVLAYLAETAEALAAEETAAVAKQRAAIAIAAKDVLTEKAKYGKALEELKQVAGKPAKTGAVTAVSGAPWSVPSLSPQPM